MSINGSTPTGGLDALAFRELMAAVRGGCADAAQHFCELFSPSLLRVVRRRMALALRSDFDSQDLLQNVWKSFFEAFPEHDAFASPDALKAYLQRMAANKTADAACAVRRRRAEISVGGQEAPTFTPSQYLLADEEFERLLRRTPTHYHDALHLLRSGATQAEVARQLGISERTIRRILRRLETEVSL